MPMMARTTVSIPVKLIPKLEQWGKLTAQIFGELRRSEGIVPDGVPEDQRWFWTKRWQRMEQEADQAIANGDVVSFDNVISSHQYPEFDYSKCNHLINQLPRTIRDNVTLSQ
jgi:hypothetical protein